MAVNTMKMEAKKYLVTSFLLFSIFILSFSMAAAAAAQRPNPPVKDSDGKELKVGVKYYILPVRRGSGGGLTISNLGIKDTCPRAVIQDHSELSRGIPLTFTPVNHEKKGGIIRTSIDLNIKFSSREADKITAVSCRPPHNESYVWKVEKLNQDPGNSTLVVATGGVEGNPGPKTLSNWFKIEKVNEDFHWYKLVFCPTVCNFCKVVCKDIGVFFELEDRRLALTDSDPFSVFFKKA